MKAVCGPASACAHVKASGHTSDGRRRGLRPASRGPAQHSCPLDSPPPCHGTPRFVASLHHRAAAWGQVSSQSGKWGGHTSVKNGFKLI